MQETQNNMTEHFEKMAAEYDYRKNKNWYYYKELKKIAVKYSKNSGSVLDAGCGTGTILRTIKVRRGIGIDISPAMIEIAKASSANYSNLAFFASDIVNFRASEKFDLILLMDVIEHLAEPEAVIKALKKLAGDTGLIVITMANPLWEPILILGEKLGLKMPEGPHYRLPASQLIKLAEKSGLYLKTREWHLFFPKYIPFVSWFINYLGQLPLIKRFCMIEVFVFGQAATANKIG